MEFRDEGDIFYGCQLLNTIEIVISFNCRIYKNHIQFFFYQNAEFDDSSMLYMI